MLTLSNTLTEPFFYVQDSLRLSDIASLCGGTVERDAAFKNLGMFRTFGKDLLVVYYDERFKGQLEEYADNFSAVVTTRERARDVPESLGVMICDDPMQAFLKLHIDFCNDQHSFYVANHDTYIDPTSTVHSSANIAAKNVHIGANVTIEPHVTIYDNCFIDDGSYIGAGCVLGGRGFEVREVAGERQYIPHAGGVAIGKNVDIFANTAVVRAVFKGGTIIGDGCKIDNLVHVAHGAVIGQDVNLVAGSSIGGTTRVGDNSWVGPNAVLSNSIIVGAGCWVALGSVVAKDVESGHRIGGPFSRRMP